MRFSVRRFAFAIALCAPFATPARVAAQRQRYSMDPAWRFTLGDAAGAERPAFDDRAWRRLDLPHDWSIEGAVAQDAPAGGRGGFFPTGIGWYRKAFTLPAGARGKAVWLEFDGVYQNADVWLNGTHLGNRPYGYSSFAFDVSQAVVSGVNVVAVRVDNSRQPNSRWYTGSGIYRHVWLTVADPLHVAHWGTYVTTPRADSSSADIVIRTSVENSGAAARQAVVRSIVRATDGHEVARAETSVTVPPGEAIETSQRVRVASPRLWSVDDPALYSLRTEIADGARTADTLATTFGIRSIRYDADRGFFLNGRHLKLRGVNLHHDAGGLGAAVPERVWERRLETLKQMGVNAIRTSHNPPAPEFLDLCDRLGFMVMAEAFDEWTIGKVDHGYHQYFAEWSERDVVDFVHRDRNHPSIVLWSAGNEIGEQSTPDGDQVLRRLVGFFHREDPTRPVTTGNDNIVADGHPATLAFLDAEDIVGYNYVDRWHERRELMAEADHHAHPGWKMVGTESGTLFSSLDERYSLGTDSAVPHPNYNSGMTNAERLWKWITIHDYFSGNFMWTGVDYLGEAFWPFKGFGSGALDVTGRPKDAFYLYAGLWTTPPMVHLLPHWNWPGREGQVIPVLAYTNCNRVELFLNGRSLGEKRVEFPAQGTSGGWNTYALPVVNPTTNDLHVEWDVPYQPGVLRAVGRTRDGRVACETEVRTAGAPMAVRLEADRDTITTAMGDVSHVEIEIVDSAGVVVPTAENMVTLTVTGGTLLTLDNANMQDRDAYGTDHRRAFNGHAIAYLRAAAPGAMRVTVSSPGLANGAVTIQVARGALTPSIPAAR